MDHYSTLGVPKNADAKSIKHAYKKLASKHHPDKGGDEAEFKKVQSAYETLSNPQKRQEYDNPNPFGGQGFSQQNRPFDMNDIFNGNSPFGDIFGSQRRQQRPMFRTTIQVSLKQAYSGSSHTVEMQTDAGKKVVTINIPKGVQTGQQIRLDNVVPNGTLIVDFYVMPDFNFEVRGQNLFCVHPISVLDLIVGTHFEFHTISDKKLRVTVQPQTQPDSQIKLTGHGMPIPGSGIYGNQIILLKPIIPAIIETEIVNVIKKYKDIQDLISNK